MTINGIRLRHPGDLHRVMSVIYGVATWQGEDAPVSNPWPTKFSGPGIWPCLPDPEWQSSWRGGSWMRRERELPYGGLG